MSAPSAPVHPPRIAVVEDDPSARAMLKAWLYTQGCVSELFADAASADVALRAQEFDLLICDMGLPDRIGIELAAAIGEPNLGLPVIFLTGEPTLETAIHSVRLRAVAYLVKPPNLDELSAVLHREAAAHRCRRAVLSSRRHLADWDRELLRLDQLAGTPNAQPAIDYLQITVRHLGLMLHQLDRSVSLLGADASGRELFEKLDVISSLRRTVEVIEGTRYHFKSKELGELRKDLEVVLRRVEQASGKST